MKRSDKIIYFFIGTVAELIKLSPVVKRFNKNGLKIKFITSGQNRINWSELKPLIGNQEAYIEFKPKSKESSALKFALWSFRTLFTSIIALNNEFKGKTRKEVYMVVHGDPISAFIGALAAKLNGLKVVHIESGLRSFNFFEPFPEEITRFFISYLADIHFSPNEWSLNNIRNHNGIKINTKQNTLYEACMNALKFPIKSNVLNSLRKEKYFLVIMHRQEHVLYKKELTKKYLNILINFSTPNLKCVLVLHSLTKDFIDKEGLIDKIEKNPNVITIPRMPYLEFIKIINKADFMATDGGSNQEEAYYLGKPCLILRKCSERKEGLGLNAVLAKDNLNVVAKFLNNYQKLKQERISVKVQPSKIVLDYLLPRL